MTRHIFLLTTLILNGCASQSLFDDGIPYFSHSDDIKASEQAVTMRRPGQLSLEIHFDTNSDTIEPQSLANLDELASLAQDFQAQKILIIGHADNRDTSAYNMQLSTRRAQRVSEYLETRGISTAVIEVQAKGEGKPTATNTTPGGRALNRRTQVMVIF